MNGYVNETFRLYQEEQKISDNIYPEFYTSYYDFFNYDNILLDDDSMNYFRYIIKMNCEKIKMEYGRFDKKNNEFPVSVYGNTILYCQHKDNSPFLTYLITFIIYQHGKILKLK